MSTQRRNGSYAIAFLVAALLAVMGAGCGSKAVQTTASVHVYAGLDVSASDRERWRSYGLLVDDIASILRPQRDSLTLYSVDRDTYAFYDKPVGEDSDEVGNALTSEIAKIVAANAHSPRRGTFPAKFWEAVAGKAAGEKRPVLVVYCSDGDNDDERSSSAQAIRSAARALAANPNVINVSIYGLSSENFAYWEQCMKPLGSRFCPHGKTDMDLTPLLGQVQAAQSSVTRSGQFRH